MLVLDDWGVSEGESVDVEPAEGTRESAELRYAGRAAAMEASRSGG